MNSKLTDDSTVSHELTVSDESTEAARSSTTAVGTVAAAGITADVSTGRTLLLVVGSGRSGTSVFASLLPRLRFSVPQPEVAADQSNPRGFGEPQWVVDFHTELLREARVQTTDARPGAWAMAGQRCYDQPSRDVLRRWLAREFTMSDNVLIKDPRLLWFVPLWRHVGQDLGAQVRFVTMLRHPAEVVRSKETWYEGTSNPANRLAGWVNTMLYTERATRHDRRAFVGLNDLLADWTLSVARAGDALGLHVLHQCSTQEMREASAVIEPTLHRSKATLEDFAVPEDLRGFARRVWDELLVLAAADTTDPAAAYRRLDQIRGEYIVWYEQIEAVAYSSIVAAHRHCMRRARQEPATGLSRVIQLVPPSWRDAVPIAWRRKVLQVIR